MTGVRHVEVINGVNGGDEVTAVDGAVLTSFSADIDFDIMDTAQAIAAEVTGAGNFSTDLDDAGRIFITGGTVNVSDADAIQAISGYDEGVQQGGVSYEISDSVSI